MLILWLISERWRLLRRSTYHRRTGGLRNFSNLYILPKINPLLSNDIKKWLANLYHSKILRPDLDQAAIAINRDTQLRDLEQIVPYSMARSLVLNGPLDIAVHEYSRHHAHEKPGRHTQVRIVVGRPFVNFTLEHHPRDSRRLTQLEALDLLRAEHQRGHVHTAWFKERFFVIRNCCKCYCGGIEAVVEYNLPTLASSGYVAEVDDKRCSGCGMCEEVCPFNAIYVDEVAFVDRDTCMGCGVCAGKCSTEAISLARDEGKGIPLDVRMLAKD